MKKIIPVGKLPNDMLRSILADIRADDASLLVGPGVGEDAAVVDVEQTAFIVVTTDPITFTADTIGYYAVTVSANDIAVIGAVPRWFFPTLLLPGNMTEAGVRRIFAEIHSAASTIGVSVSGGHTEVTTAVTRPVVCGAMIGTAGRETLKLKSSIVPGDAVVMTKTAGNEGTAIIARDFEGKLIDGGVTPEEISRAKGFLDRLSVLPAARLGGASASVRAMHDVPDGGVATALSAIAAASGCGRRVLREPSHRRRRARGGRVCEGRPRPRDSRGGRRPRDGPRRRDRRDLKGRACGVSRVCRGRNRPAVRLKGREQGAHPVGNPLIRPA